MQKIKILGATELFFSTLDQIESVVEEIGVQLPDFRRDLNLEDFDSIVKNVQKMHALFGNIMTYLNYKAFWFDVLPQADSNEESSLH